MAYGRHFVGGFRLRLEEAEAGLTPLAASRDRGHPRATLLLTRTGVVALSGGAAAGWLGWLRGGWMLLLTAAALAFLGVVLALDAARRRTDRRVLEQMQPFRASLAARLAEDGYAEPLAAADELILRARFRRDGETFLLRRHGDYLGLVRKGDA